MKMRPCWVEIDTRSFEDNYRFLARLAAPNAVLLAMLKADAYGHGLALCAPAAVRAGAQWLGVTCVEEAVAVRALSPHAHVLVVSGVFPGQGSDVVRHQLTSAVWESWHLDELEAAARASDMPSGSLPVHVEIDTGMSRQGAAVDALPQLLARFTAASPLKLEAIMTHLFAADNTNGNATGKQLAQLNLALEKLAATGLHAEWLNVGNSAALLAGYAPALAELAARYGMKAMMRPGLSLFGLAPEFAPPFDTEPTELAAAHIQLKRVLTWKTKVVAVRTVPPGTVVGYNGTFVATGPMRLALLPVGYADGLVRQLGNRFSLLVRGQRAPLVGRVSMDQTVLDVTEIAGVDVGDEVVLLGTQGSECITAFDHAAATGTIPWEVFTRIGPRVPRLEKRLFAASS